jgi:hypothetical protein
MKRIALLLVGFSFLFSCKKESTLEPSKEIIGKWKVVSVTENDYLSANGRAVTPYTTGSYIEFFQGGTVTSHMAEAPSTVFYTGTATFQVVGNNLTYDNDQTNIFIISFPAKNSLILHEQDGGDDFLLERY